MAAYLAQIKSTASQLQVDNLTTDLALLYHTIRCTYPHTFSLPGAYTEVAQIICLLKETVVIISNVVQICGIILEIIQNGHNCTLLVVWEQWLKTDVLKSDAMI